jgi:hypothetical protein
MGLGVYFFSLGGMIDQGYVEGKWETEALNGDKTLKNLDQTGIDGDDFSGCQLFSMPQWFKSDTLV